MGHVCAVKRIRSHQTGSSFIFFLRLGTRICTYILQSQSMLRLPRWEEDSQLKGQPRYFRRVDQSMISTQ
jgi:hypothetical protein